MMLRRTMMKMALGLAVSGTALAGVYTKAWLGDGGGGESPLERAHAAYLEKDWATMTTAVRDVLVDGSGDEATRANALELLARANQETKGRLPTDWQAPDGVSNITFSHIRKQEPEELLYKVQLRAHMSEKDLVTQAQLVRVTPGGGAETILDRRAGLGDWSVADEESGSSFDLEVQRRAPLREGLYEMRFELKDGRRASGWIVVSDLTSTATPVVREPTDGTIVPHGNPKVEWDDFRSPEAKDYEARKLNLYVVKLLPRGDEWSWDVRWGMYGEAPAPSETSTVVGRDVRGEGVDALEAGDYWLAVTYFEQRKLGPVKMRRGSRTARHFEVR